MSVDWSNENPDVDSPGCKVTIEDNNVVVYLNPEPKDGEPMVRLELPERCAVNLANHLSMNAALLRSRAERRGSS